MPRRQNKIRSSHRGRETEQKLAARFTDDDWKFARPLCLVVIVFATFVVYWPACNGRQLWDDDANLTRPDLQSLHGLYRIWFEIGATQQYYPVLHSAFWIEQRLWGDSVLGYHLINVVWHSISVTLLYLILNKLKIPGALLAATIFAVHPVMVESVAWIAEQKNTLSTLFYLGAVLAYLKFDETRDRSRYWVALALFALALLAKTATVTLPFALLVIFWWQRGTLSWRRDVVPLVPFVGLGVATGLMTMWVESALVGVEGTGTHLELTPLQRCLVAGRDIWFYLGKLIWPNNLSFVYEHWNIDPTQYWQWTYLIAAIATTFILWTVRKRWRGPLACWLYFCGTLGPVLGFLDVFMFRYSFVADHLQYLASLGIIAFVSGVIVFAIARATQAIRWIGVASCIGLVTAFAVLSWRQSHIYADTITLYEATLELNANAWLAHNNLASELAGAGKTAEAIEHYRNALRIKPDFAVSHINIASIRIKNREYQEAIDEIQAALSIEPKSAVGHNYFGNALMGIGQPQEAIREYREAIRLDSEFFEAYHNLGLALMQQQQLPEAIEQFQHAIQLRPNDSDAHNSLGSALDNSGKLVEAIDEFRVAVDLDPNYAIARYNFGNALVRTGRGREAVEHLECALRLKPDFLEAHVTLAKGLALAGRPSEAIATAEKAIQIGKASGRQLTVEPLEEWLTHYRIELERTGVGIHSQPPK
jgi:tetratricopeptide (TPR) repeat protein